MMGGGGNNLKGVSMKFKIEPSQEDFDIVDYISMVFAGIIMALWGGITLYDKWCSRNKGASNEEKIDEFRNDVKKADLLKFKDQLSTLDDKVADKLLDTKVSFTPQMLQADIQLNQAIQKEYSTVVAQMRKKALALTPKDIGENGKKIDALYNEYDKLYGTNASVNPKDYGVDGKKFDYWDIPKKYDALLKTLFSDVGTKSMKELGWNKSNLGLLVDHMIRFWYDNIDFEDNVYSKQNDAFYAASRSLLAKAMPFCDWYNEWINDADRYTPGKPNDPSNIKKALEEVDEDDGACAYAYGQELGWFLEFPFSHCIITGHKLLSINVVIKFCRELKTFTDKK